MSELINTIKNLSHKVSEDYLIFGKDMNDSLVTLYQEGEIENAEILKRICEQANQNVYLALFHNPDTDKSNIKFDLADFKKVSEIANESEEAMKDYNTPPKDFRSNLEIAVMPDATNTDDTAKVAELRNSVEYRQVLRNFLSRVESMKTAECNCAENAFDSMAKDAEALVANGESIGDISKIATRFVRENIGGNFVKVAECYNEIYNELLKTRPKMKCGFTKISSQKINDKSAILAPVRDFSHSIAKIAGLTEMEENIKKALELFDKGIHGNISFKAKKA